MGASGLGESVDWGACGMIQRGRRMGRGEQIGGVGGKDFMLKILEKNRSKEEYYKSRGVMYFMVFGWG